MLDNPTSYCEYVHGMFFTQPINTFSNVIFLISAFLSYRYLQINHIRKIYILPILLICIALSSALWHTSTSHIGDILDTTSIAVFTAICLILLLNAVTKNYIKTIFWFILLLTVTFFVERLQAFNGSLVYVVLLIALFIIGYKYKISFPTSRKYVNLSLIFFVVAIIFRGIDNMICSHINIGTHFVWHILMAVLGYLLIRVISFNYQNK